MCISKVTDAVKETVWQWGASLAVILANICMKIFEEKLSTEDEMSLGETKTLNRNVPSVIKKGAWNSKMWSAKNVKTGMT